MTLALDAARLRTERQRGSGNAGMSLRDLWSPWWVRVGLVVILVWGLVSPVIVGAWLLAETPRQLLESETLPFLLRAQGVVLVTVGPLAAIVLLSLVMALVALMLAGARYLWLRAEAARGAEGAGEASAGREEQAPAPNTVEELRQAIAERKWADVDRLLDALQGSRPDLAQDLLTLAERERSAHARELRQALQEAQSQNNPQAVLDVRDRLVGLLEISERQDLDREIARWSIGYLREALHEGRARELIDLIERMVATFGESTTEGMELKNALPILRRSAGRCPDCGEPYDISLERCPDCEQKRRMKKAESSATGSGGNGGISGNRFPHSSDENVALDGEPPSGDS